VWGSVSDAIGLAEPPRVKFSEGLQLLFAYYDGSPDGPPHPRRPTAVAVAENGARGRAGRGPVRRSIVVRVERPTTIA